MLAGGAVRLDHFPSDGWLYPRGATGSAAIDVVGAVLEPGWERVELEVDDGSRVGWRAGRELDFEGDSAGFALAVRLPAGLVEYGIRLTLVSGARRHEVARADRVVVGDVYLVQGQSNAVAADYHDEGRTNAELQRPWIRSFGTASTNPALAESDLEWHVADGEGENGRGTVGSWALRMAQLLSERTGVPIGLLNGAVGGTPISYHQRDDADPENLETNYGRLLYRARRAGVAESARGLLFYQGEAEGAEYRSWVSGFVDLHEDWRGDFPGLERIYLFQIRNSCGFATRDVQSAQRLVPDVLPGVSVVSTSAIRGHDFCHFYYEGYRQMGTQVAQLLGRDLYGVEAPLNLDPPNIDFAFFSSPARDEITLVMRDRDDALSVDPGAEDDFELSDGTRVVAVRAEGPDLVLGLAGPSDATVVGYEAHRLDGPFVTNAAGRGILVFQVPLAR